MSPVKNRVSLSRKTALNISRCKSEIVVDPKPLINSSGDVINKNVNSEDPCRKIVSMEDKLVAAYKAAKAKDNEYPSEDEFIELRNLKLLREQKIHEFIEDRKVKHVGRGDKLLEESLSEALMEEAEIPTSQSNIPLARFKMSNESSAKIQPPISLNNLGPNLSLSDQKNPDSSHRAVTITDKSVKNRHLRSDLRNIKMSNVIISDSEDEVIACSQKPVEKRFLKTSNDCNIMYRKSMKPEIAGRPQVEEKKKVSPAGGNTRPHSVKPGCNLVSKFLRTSNEKRFLSTNNDCNSMYHKKMKPDIAGRPQAEGRRKVAPAGGNTRPKSVTPGCNLKSKFAVKKENAKSDAAVQTMAPERKDWQVSEALIIWPDLKMHTRKRLDYSYVRKLWWRKK